MSRKGYPENYRQRRRMIAEASRRQRKQIRITLRRVIARTLRDMD